MNKSKANKQPKIINRLLIGPDATLIHTRDGFMGWIYHADNEGRVPNVLDDANDYKFRHPLVR